MKNCPRCGFVNDDSAKFCKQCGEKLDIPQKENINTCSHCGKELPKGALFCKHCGTQVKQTQKQQNNQKPESALPKRQTTTDVNNTRRTRASTPSTQYQSETSKSKGVTPNVHPLVLGLCLAIVVIVFIAFIALSSTGSNDNTTSDNSNQNYTTENDSYEEEYNDTTYDSNSNYDDNSSIDTMEDNYSEEGQDNNIEPEAETSEYVLPTSDSEYLTRDDLAGFTAEECRLARNEIYARHGRMFLDEELQNYFNSFDWYQPTIEPDDFQESMLNQYEIANRDLIVAYETEQGYR